MFFAKAHKRLNSDQSRTSAVDHDFILRLLRRELANWMLQHEPDRYLEIYRKAHNEAKVLSFANRNDQQALYTEICKRYPHYTDLDMIGMREHVLYRDALSWNTYEDVEHHFLNLVRFHALQIALYKHDNWWGFDATSDDDLEHLEEDVQRFKDRQFKKKLNYAINDFLIYWRGKGDEIFENSPLYKTSDLIVYLVPHVAKRHYGFHFRDTDEFGLYVTFHDDKSKPVTGLYRSNAEFEKVICLDGIGYF